MMTPRGVSIAGVVAFTLPAGIGAVLTEPNRTTTRKHFGRDKMRKFLLAAIAAMSLAVGPASAYAGWLQDHSRPAYSDDSAAGG